MKKILIYLFFVLFFFSAPELEAASATYYPYVKSPKYSSTYHKSSYSHIGYYFYSEQSGNTRRQIYSDVFVRDYYKVSYVGILGSPQATYAGPIVRLEKIYVDKLSFFMSEEFIHSNKLALVIVLDINDVKGGFGIVWSKVTRYSQGEKLTSNVPSPNNAPLVALVVYKVEARVYEVINEGISTRSWFLGSWSDYQWTRKENPLQWVTIGYVGCYTFLGDGNDTDYLSGYYLINNHPEFHDNNKFRTY